MKLFGLGGNNQRKFRLPERKFRIVSRAPGDTSQLDPAIAEAVRNMGLDPTKFTATPYEEGETDAALGSFGTPGTHVEHTYLFPSLTSAFSAMERLLDATTSARIRQESGGWLVSFDAPPDPANDDSLPHQRFTEVATGLGAQDRGFSRASVQVSTTLVQREGTVR